MLALYYSTKINGLFISSEGFFALEKNPVICSQRGLMPNPIQSDVTALYR
jgi:hypothetical protein